jgi:hypothetical protein
MLERTPREEEETIISSFLSSLEDTDHPWTGLESEQRHSSCLSEPRDSFLPWRSATTGAGWNTVLLLKQARLYRAGLHLCPEEKAEAHVAQKRSGLF